MTVETERKLLEQAAANYDPAARETFEQTRKRLRGLEDAITKTADIPRELSAFKVD